MKPAAVIRQGTRFVTRRATTEEPREIQRELRSRGILHVFKGDQNQAWDAVLANHCLARAVGEQEVDTVFFVQDEKLGTPDLRLARAWRERGARYALTEDYYRSRSGAVWEHQDVSYGLFYTEPVSPEQFAAAAVHLPRTADRWARHRERALDPATRAALASLGVPLAGAPADAATRLGPPADAEALAACFRDTPPAELYYALTKSDGLYGVIPTENQDVTLGSIPLVPGEWGVESGEWGAPDSANLQPPTSNLQPPTSNLQPPTSNLQPSTSNLQPSTLWDYARRLLVRVAARGALRQAASPAHRREVLARVRRLAAWAGDFLERNPGATVADFQAALGQHLTAETFPQDRYALTRASELLRAPNAAPAAAELHLFLDLALRAPAEFAAAYNEALVRAGLGLQRVKSEPERATPPFFVEYAPEGPATPIYRYAVEIAGADARVVVLTNPTAGALVLEAPEPVRSAAAFFALLRSQLRPDSPLAVAGKAGPFMAELRRWPHALGLPRQGSRYAPMVDYLVDGLLARGLLKRPDSLVIRIGLNALDRLEGVAGLRLRLPRFLEGVLGREIDAGRLAREWRAVAAEAQALLALLRQCEFGQHVHLVKLFALNTRGETWEAALAADPRLARLAARLDAVAGEPGLLRRLGRDLPPEAVALIDRETARRAELLAERRRLRERVAPETLEALRVVDLRLLIVYAAYVRRLWQRADSLPYLNDRPYSLALYLLFGPEFFHHLCRHVEFDLEYTTAPSPDPCGAAT